MSAAQAAKSFLLRVAHRAGGPLVHFGSVHFFACDVGVEPPRAARPPGGLTVRVATVADLDALRQGRRPSLDAGALRERFARGELCFVAEDAGGRFAHSCWATLTAGYIPELGLDLELAAGEAYVYDGYTRPELRGRDVFAATRVLLFERLREAGCRRLYTYVRGDNLAGLTAARHWERPLGALRYLRLRERRPWIWGRVSLRLVPHAQGPRLLPPGGPPSTRGPGTGPGLSLEVVEDTAGLLALEPRWRSLVDRVAPEHPFLTHEWVRTWWEAFGAGKRLHVVVVRRGGECVGIAPCMHGRARMYGLIGVRRLELLAGPHTPRCDLLIAEPRAAVYRALRQHFLDVRSAWDVLVMQQLDSASPTLDGLLPEGEDGGLRVGQWTAPASPVLRLAGDYASYMSALPRKLRANLRNRQRRLGELGPVAMEIVRGEPGLARALDDGFRIEAAAWKGQNGTAIASQPDVRRFYERLAAATSARGWLDLRFLSVGGRRVAFGYCLRYRDTLFLLKQGYDPAFAAFSPFNQLCQLVIEDCYAHGVANLDFLGCEEDWKLQWTRESRAHRWLFAFAPTLRARLLHAVKFELLPALR